MKTLQLVFLFSIIGFCLADDDQYDCESNFLEAIKEINENLCLKLGSCSFNATHIYCVTKNKKCPEDETDQVKCKETIPTDFYSKKCDIGNNNKCTEKIRECGDWKTLGGVPDTLSNDICSDLSPGNNGDRCIIAHSNCEAHFNSCRNTKLDTRYKCNLNIPEEPSQKCEWNTQESRCEETPRQCVDILYADPNKDLCKILELDDTDSNSVNQKCIYDENGHRCKPEFKECKFQSFSNTEDCENYYPLNNDKDGYNYTQKCSYDALTEQCQPIRVKCSEYSRSNTRRPTNILNDVFCSSLKVSEDFYRCAYNEEYNECIEVFSSCESYIPNKVETDRDGCEGIKLSDKTKKCVYDINKDECVTKPIYEKCEDYVGKDKKTCESIILSPATRPYCILDKDSECKERPLICSEAFNRDDCLNVARASDNNKRCAYDAEGCNNTMGCYPEKPPKYCYEEYVRCEDYLGTIQYECENIKLYNGKKCKWESSRCRTNNKICEDAETEEECKSIAETGVSDTERKVCAWHEKCIETFKYCSDYREICDPDPDTSEQPCKDFCENNINPYDESGNNLDIGYECFYEDNVGCQKVQVKCSDADNPILCELYSNKIYDKDKKYCGYFKGSCKDYYKECKDVEFSSPSENNKCTDNIIQVPEGHIYGICGIENNKCVQKNKCEDFESIRPNFESSQYKYICESLDSHCRYESIPLFGTTYPLCQFKEYKDMDCESTVFYTEEEKNSEICEKIEVSNPFKKCIIKEDKSGCKKVYRELPYSTSYSSYSESQENGNQESSSGFTIKGVNLILILLCFLF